MITNAMAAQYTEITKEDIEKFFRARFRVYHPSEYLKDRGEFVYDLHLSDDVAIRVFSSIQRHGTSSGVGEDAIRVVLVSTKLDRPINKKAAKSIVKRTQGWRNSLADRIYAFIEEYHEKYDFYNAIAAGEQPPQKEPVKKPVSLMPPVREKETGDEFDSTGWYTPKPENKQKYLDAIDKLLTRIYGDYSNLIRGIGDHLRDRGKLSPKQKALIDKTLAKYNWMPLVSSKIEDIKNASFEDGSDDDFVDFNFDLDDAEEDTDLLLFDFAPEKGI